MLPLARHVSLVLNLEGLHCAPHIQIRHHLDRVPNPHVADVGLRLVCWSGDFSGQRDEMDNVKLVANKFVQDEGMVLRVVKIENNGMAPANWFAQLKNKESGRVRLSRRHRKVAGGNLNACDRLLFSGIGILDQYGTLKRNSFLLLPADQRQTAGSKESCDQQAAQGLNFVSASHPLYFLTASI